MPFNLTLPFLFISSQMVSKNVLLTSIIITLICGLVIGIYVTSKYQQATMILPSAHQSVKKDSSYTRSLLDVNEGRDDVNNGSTDLGTLLNFESDTGKSRLHLVEKFFPNVSVIILFQFNTVHCTQLSSSN